jgi:hypothetical protein
MPNLGGVEHDEAADRRARHRIGDPRSVGPQRIAYRTFIPQGPRTMRAEPAFGVTYQGGRWRAFWAGFGAA